MLMRASAHGSARLRLPHWSGPHVAGSVFPASPFVSLKQVERYDPGANKWAMVAPLGRRQQRRGGETPSCRSSSCSAAPASTGTWCPGPVLTRRRNRWSIKAECPQPWRYTAAAVLGSQIFIMGGDTEFTTPRPTARLREQPVRARIGDMTAKRMSCHALASGNKLVVGATSAPPAV